jgi:hypothetical protein
MTSIRPASAPSPGDLRRAQERYGQFRGELALVRSAASAWRNGLAALIAGLVGFGLIKGRSDIGELAPRWSAAVGILLAAGLAIGGVAAFLLMRAAYGRPPRAEQTDQTSLAASDHLEALRAARNLWWGILLMVVFVVLLVTALGITWYGPGRAEPRLRIRTDGGEMCGRVALAQRGQLTIDTVAGRVVVDMDRVTAMRPVDAC